MFRALRCRLLAVCWRPEALPLDFAKGNDSLWTPQYHCRILFQYLTSRAEPLD